jgi:hypothetical protein
MQNRRLTLSLLVLALLCAGCGRLTGSGGSASPDGIEHPMGASDLVIRWETSGGFVNPASLLGRVPSFSLYGDGTLITEGAHTEIYPGAAVPPLIAQDITEGGIQAILATARDAGLLDGDATYPFCVADVPDTVITVNAGGQTSVVTATALGMGGTGCPDANDEARAKLFRFLTRLGDLQSWLPAGSIGEEHPYTATALRIFVRPYQPDPTLTQTAVAWPGSQPLSAIDGTVEMAPEVSCGVVAGADADAVLEAARSANELTPWTSDGRRYSVVFRPLLPDESGC